MKTKVKHIFFQIAVIVFISFWSLNTKAIGTKLETSQDTIDAISLLNKYLEKSINEQIYLKNAVNLFDKLITDSLITEDFEKIKDISDIYNEDDLSKLLYLDSFIDFDLVPPHALVEINKYISELASYYEKKNFAEESYELEYTCAIPANDLYKNLWNTRNPNPYPRDFNINDTLVKLKLVNNMDEFHIPGDGWISSYYGFRQSGWHAGVDIGIYHWHPIHSIFPGVVRFARSYGGYGRVVVIRHDNGLETYYAHLSSIKVKPGERVSAGDIIGTSGNSGRSRGTHLHFEIRYKGTPINPSHIIDFKEKKLLYSEIILKRYNNLSYFVYSEDAILYKVKKGDYLYKIANEFGTTITKICDINGINRRSMLRVGQVLRIHM